MERERRSASRRQEGTSDLTNNGSVEIRASSRRAESPSAIATSATTTTTSSSTTTATSVIQVAAGNGVDVGNRDVTAVVGDSIKSPALNSSIDSLATVSLPQYPQLEALVRLPQYESSTTEVSNYPAMHALLSPLTETTIMSSTSTVVTTVSPLTLSEALTDLLTGQKAEIVEDLKLHKTLRIQEPDYPSHFWDLLKDYLEKEQRYEKYSADLLRLKAEIRSFQEKVWIIQSESHTVQGACKTCSQLLSCSEQYSTAVINNEGLANFKKSLESYRTGAHMIFMFHLYEAQLARMRIQMFIDQFLFHYFGALVHDAPVVAVNDDSSVGQQQSISEMRHLIDVLFYYARSGSHYAMELGSPPIAPPPPGLVKEITSPLLNFYKSIIGWIQHLVHVMLRVASYKDHLFILKHLINTQNSSFWGTRLIQFPPSWDVSTCEHLLTVLKHILLPVSRDSEESEVVNPEKLCLTEDDLVTFFKQVPISYFCSFVCSEQGVACTACSGGLWLQRLLMVFCRSIARFSHCKNFIKLLSKTCISLVGVLAELPSTRKYSPGENLLSELFLDVAYTLLPLHDNGVWQFLCSLPFHRITSDTAWYFLCIAYGLHKVSEPIFITKKTHWESTVTAKTTYRTSFVNNMTGVEALFVVQALVKLAATDDLDLTNVIVHELFIVSYLDATTRTSLYQVTSGLLSELCVVHPICVSWILEHVNANFKALGKQLVMYIFDSLCLVSWEPRVSDLSLLRLWLFSPLDSDECAVAQSIFSKMNFGKPFNATKNVLFPKPQFLRETVLLVLEAWEHHNSTYQQSFFSALKPYYNSFISWCWTFLTPLPYCAIYASEQAPPPLLLGDKTCTIMAKQLEVLLTSKSFAKSQAQPLPLFLTLVLTTYGCDPNNWFTGESCAWRLLSYLAHHQHYLAVLWVISDILPMAVVAHHPNNNITPVMIGTLSDLLTVKANIPRCTRILGTKQKLKPFLHRLKQILFAQILRLESSVSPFVASFWFKFVTSIENWNKREDLLSILNIVLYASFLSEHVLPLPHCQITLLDAIKATPEPQGWFKSLFAPPQTSLLPWKPAGELFGLRVSNATCANNSWVVFSVFYLETQQNAIDREKLASEIIKKSLSASQLATVISNLKLFQWANWILETPPSAPLLPVMWQMFFFLYFDIPTGLHPCTLLLTSSYADFKRKLSERLSTLSDHHTIVSKSSQNGPVIAEKHTQLASLYSAMIMWLKLTDIHSQKKRSTLLESLQPNFLPSRLASVLKQTLHDSSHLWMDLIILPEPSTKKIQHFELTQVQTPKSWIKLFSDAVFADEHCLPAPAVVLLPQVSPVNIDSLQVAIEEELRPVQQSAMMFVNNFNKHSQADVLIQNLIEKLFVNIQIQTSKDQVCTKGCPPSQFQFTLWKVQKDLQVEIQLTEAQAQANYSASIASTNDRFCVSILQIENAVQTIVHSAQYCNELERQQVHSKGILLFNILMYFWTRPEIQQYPPTHQLILQPLKVLSETFISPYPEPSEKLLNNILSVKLESLIQLFKPHLCPSTFQKMLEYTFKVFDSRSQDHEYLAKVIGQFNVKELLLFTGKGYASSERKELLVGLIRRLYDPSASDNTKIPSAEIWSWLLDSFSQLVSNDFPLLLEDSLHHLLNASITQKLPEVVWSTFIGILQGKDLPWQDRISSLDMIYNFLTKCRESYKYTLFVTWSVYVPFFCSFIKTMSNKQPDIYLQAALAALNHTFEPWFLPTDHQPWEPAHAPLASVVAQTYVEVMSQFSVYPMTLNVVWEYLLFRILPRSATHVQKLLFTEFANLPWSHWSPGQVGVAQMLEMIQTAIPIGRKPDLSQPSMPVCSAHESMFAFATTLISSVNWERGFLSEEALRVPFVATLFQLILVGLALHPLPVNQSFLVFLLSSNLNWQVLPLKVLSDLLDLFVEAYTTAQSPDAVTQQNTTPYILERWEIIVILAARGFGLETNKSCFSLGSATLDGVCHYTRFLASLYQSAIAHRIPPNCIPLLLNAVSISPLSRDSYLVSFYKDLIVIYNNENAMNISNLNSHLEKLMLAKPVNACHILSAGCQCLASTHIIAHNTELCCELYFRALSQWEQLIPVFQAPQLEEVPFINFCVASGYIFTLYLTGRKKLMEGDSNMIHQSTQWLDSLIPNAKPESAHKLLLIIFLFLESICVSLANNKLSMESAVRGPIASIVQKLGKVTEDRSFLSTIILKASGTEGKQELPVATKVALRAVKLFINLQISGGQRLRVDPATPPSPSSDAISERQAFMSLLSSKTVCNSLGTTLAHTHNSWFYLSLGFSLRATSSSLLLLFFDVRLAL
ncbi:ectopic P granules protein 5 [Pelomyxa schiedti]|nr:ectopic P granules protein 5 [Pelomyxa schiedti]